MQAPLRAWHACTLVTRDPADDASRGRDERGHGQLPGPAWPAWFRPLGVTPAQTLHIEGNTSCTDRTLPRTPRPGLARAWPGARRVCLAWRAPVWPPSRPAP